MNKCLIPILLLCCSAPASAQTFTTGNQFVSANVDGQSGRISFYAEPGHQLLSFPGHSYLSIMVDSQIYSNNDVTADTLAGHMNTADSYKSGDTVFTRWNLGAFTLTQSVYPVAYRESGQIATRFFVGINGEPKKAVQVQAQYLLDLDVAASDRIGVATVYDFSLNRLEYGLHGRNPVPSFFIAAKNLGPSPTLPSLIAQGRWRDYQQKFVNPIIAIDGDWTSLSNFGFGPSDIPADGLVNDNAVYTEWPSFSIPSGGREVGSFSYGTAKPTVCTGDATVMTFQDRDWADYYLGIDTTEVTSLIWNTHPASSETAVKATLTTWPPARIIEPADATASGTTETQSVKDIAALGMSGAHWTLTGGPGVTTPSLVPLNVAVRGGNIDFPPQNCGDSLRVFAEFADLYAATFSVRTTGGMRYPCNARCYDGTVSDDPRFPSGLASVSVLTSSNMSFVGKPFVSGDLSAQFQACVVDSMLDGAISIEVKDVAGNTHDTSFHYCTIADTIAPLVVSSFGGNGLLIVASDRRAWDRGLDSLFVTEQKNVVFDRYLTYDSVHARPLVFFTANPVDPKSTSRFCVEATDLVGHHSPKYCYTLSTAGVVQSPASVSLEVYPNPASRTVHIRMSGAASGSIAIFDLLGHEVGRAALSAGVLDWDASQLQNGIYIVRLEADGVVTSRQITIAR